MPPANNTFATATNIPSFPYDFTQTDINDGGVNFTVYYKFVVPAGINMIGAWGFSGNIGAGYRPRLRPYLGPAGAPTPVLNILGGNNKPIQFPVTAGSEYFLEFQKNLDDAGPNQLRVRVEVGPIGAIQAGNIMVNDDSNGFPLAALSHNTDFQAVKYIHSIAAGEAGDIFRDTIVLEKFSDNTIRVYNRNFTEIGNLAMAAGSPRIRTCHGQSKFFLAIDRNPVQIRDILTTGAYGAINLITTLTNCRGFAVSNDGLIGYNSSTAANSPVRRWDMVGNVALSDLSAGFVNEMIVDILVLQDNSIVVLYEIFGGGTVTVRRFSAAGAVLNTYNMGINGEPAGTFARLAYALDNPNSFWVWMHPSGTFGLSVFHNIKVSDGSTIAQRQHAEYELGDYQPAETATPLARFGNSFSCPFFIMTGDSSGIYFIDTNKAQHHDSYYTDVEKKIPDPLWKTALVGE